ncbi:MAG: membrane protein insertase YidC [Gammaproteobacteria bacterium]|nr:membrane protein insertase YidC [Gammaproteobacteria bacterium]
MENQRLLLYFTLFFIVYLLWAEWQMDYGPKPETAPRDTARPVQQQQEVSDVPDAAATPVEAAIDESSIQEQPGRRRIRVLTDVLDIEIDTKGGDIIKAVLRDYSKKADNPEQKLVLLTDGDYNFFVAQSGLVSVNKGTAPTHNAVYSVENDRYRLSEGVDEIKIPLTWNGENGVQVSKVYTFRRNDYVIDLEHVVNAGDEEWSGSQYMQLVRVPPSEDDKSAFIYTYTGGVVYNDEIKYEKIDFEDIAEQNLLASIGDGCLNLSGKQKGCELTGGWLAMIQHYFLAAWIPESGVNNLFYTRNPSGTSKYILGTRSPAQKIAAQESGSFNTRLVIGPKLQNQLEDIAPGLELTVDYGVLTIIAKPLFWLLDIFHGWFGNWGWAIIFLTITVKAVFYKLSEMSYRSMAKMRKVAPRIKQMKERFGDDRQAMSKAMMDMYKREKINPMGGCFPILVQMPVFIALYWVLLESVEMRHAPFILWIDNLSARDPYFILPIIMGVSMWIQQKLNPAPVDPVQQKIFQYMPFVFTAMFAFFPSGLVLYWVVNNILSIAQQYVITKRIEKAA